jgi:hypothetical protein
MATPEEIRKKLETQATQRVNPLLKGLTMLTGGLAGEFTGTNEQIRQRNLAKRALMEEDLASLQEQRLNERMKAQRGQMLEDELKRIAAQDEAIARRQRDAETAAREAKRPEMRGLLESRPNYQVGGDRGLGGAMAAPISALEPIEEVERQYSYEKALQGQEEEARRIKSGYMSYNIPGRGTIGGTPEQIEAMAEKDPVLKKFISQAPSEEPPFSTSWDTNPFTGAPTVKMNFKGSTPYEEQKRLVEQFMGQSGSNPFAGETPPGTTSTKKEEKPTDIKGFTVKRIK